MILVTTITYEADSRQVRRFFWGDSYCGRVDLSRTYVVVNIWDGYCLIVPPKNCTQLLPKNWDLS